MVSAAVLGILPSAVAKTADPLAALRWEKRIVLVFPQGDRERERMQARALPADGMRERDVVLIRVPEGGDVAVPGVGTVEGASLRSAYGVDAGSSFTVMLVGKDGGVKRRSQEPIAARELFAAIDAMPMRRQEMRGD